MGNTGESLESFICYNCKEKNFFNKADYLSKSQAESEPASKTGTPKVKEVSIECKSCREWNSVAVKF